MKISTKGRYGLRILLDIARNGGDGLRLIRDISESQKISEKYVGRLMIELRKAGFVESTRGAHGGYTLNRDPDSLTLLEIVEAMEGDMSLVDCVACPKKCSKSANCPAREVWKSVNEKIRGVFAGVTLRDVMNGSGGGFGVDEYCI